jgi:hypothetical protein
MTVRLTRLLAAALCWPGGSCTTARRAVVASAGIAFAAGSLAALVLSRTVGVFGFMETVWTPQAIKTLASEVGAILTLGVALTMQVRAARQAQHRSALLFAPTARFSPKGS